MRFTILGVPAFFTLAACTPTGTATEQLASAASEPPVLVTGICGDCHAVTANALSPNPQAPGFADIANSPQVTHDTLVAFLSDAHNYPLQMDVDLAPEDIQQIADHMMSLRSEDYFKTPS